jgi:hypothetical protein
MSVKSSITRTVIRPNKSNYCYLKHITLINKLLFFFKRHKVRIISKREK